MTSSNSNEPFPVHDRLMELADLHQDIFPSSERSQAKREAFMLGFILADTAWLPRNHQEREGMRQALKENCARHGSG